MIKLDLTNIVSAPDDWSEIFDYHEDIDTLENALEQYKGIKKIILVGNGGAITSYDAYYNALVPKTASETVWTMEPDYLEKVRKESPIEDTIIVAASKGGNTLGQIEALLYFADYKVIVITTPHEGTLSQIAQRMNWQVISHPPIRGRFSGGTSCAFVPAILAGMNARLIQSGIEVGHELKDEAYSLSKYMYDLEQKGYGEVFIPIYSSFLRGFQNLIIQLMHESVCKGGKGQTFYAALSPESQHHTNQRLFGGKKNVIGLFVTVKHPWSKRAIEIPDTIKNTKYKDTDLEVIDGYDYQDALRAEYLGTKGDADENEIPNVTLEIDKITPESIGELVGFWHLVAFYSSRLREVNPFDQPAVLRSKDITLSEILKNRG